MELFLKQPSVQTMRNTLPLSILKVHHLLRFPPTVLQQFLQKLSKKPVKLSRTASIHARETIGHIMLPITSALQVKQPTWLRGVWAWAKIYVQSGVAKLLTIKNKLWH